MSTGLDFAFNPHPPAAAVKAAGYAFVGRYVSPQAANDASGKNLLPAEYTAIKAAGLAVILYEEQGAARMLGGKLAGTADAQHFDAVVKALGMPGAVMFACADWDVTPAQQTPVNAYLDGVISVLGLHRTGIYGGYWAVSRALDAGKAAYAVQTYAWSGWNTAIPLPSHAVKWVIGTHAYFADSRAQVRQGESFTFSGADCDHLEALTADYGQFPRPAPAPPPYPAAAGLAVAGKTVTATVKWQPVLIAGKPVASYLVECWRLSDKKLAAKLATADTHTILPGLAEGTAYEVRVYAQGGPGQPGRASVKFTA